MANAIYQQVRRRNLLPERALRALNEFAAINFQTYSYPELPIEAFKLASDHEIPSIYDAMYLALASQLDAEFWTADQRLLRALGDDFPNAHWIGDYEPA